jgi:predicted DNA-binding protein
MAGRLVRTQILLEAEQHQRLREQAHASGKSVSELVREALAEHFGSEHDAEVTSQIAALGKVRALRATILARRGGQPVEIDPVAIIEEIREERNAEISGIAPNNCDRR